MDMASFRQQYPQYNSWSDERIQRAIDKKHQAEGVPEGGGIAGIGQDISESLLNLPEAAGRMIPDLAKGAAGAAKNIVTHPIRSAINAGAGVGEGAKAMLNLPGNVMDYLARKGLVSQESADKTLHIPADLGIEKKLGIDQGDKGDQFIRAISSLLIPGKAAKALLPAKAAIPFALAANAAGENQDPLQAGILGILGEKAVRTLPRVPRAAAKTVKAIPEVASNLPEYANKAAGSVLEGTADYASKVPMVGPIIQPTLGALGARLKYTSVLPEEMAQRKLFGDINSEHLPLIQERSAAANRLGFNITPAEASLSPFEARKQATIGRTREGEKVLFEKGRNRSSKEETSINTLLDNIYDEDKLAPEKKAAYKKTMQNDVPPEFIEKYSKNPLIADVIKKMDSDPIYKTGMEGVKKNSFEYWDHVKRILGDIGEREKELGRATYGSDVAAKARRSMVDEMDKIAPDYKTARKISERNFVRNDIENFFDKRKMTGNNFAKLLNSEKKYNGLLSKLEPYPEAVQNLKDMKMVFGDLIPTDPSIRTAAAMEKTSMWNARNKLDALKQALDQKYGEKHDVAAVKLMTDPNWQSLLQDYLRKHGR